MAAIKAYRPRSSSLCSGQVLQQPYPADKGRLVLREMADLLALDLVEKELMTDQIVLTVGYDIANLTDPQRRAQYRGPVVRDGYGRQVPQHAQGTANLPGFTSSAREIVAAAAALYDRIVDGNLLVRRLTISANRLQPEAAVLGQEAGFEQLDLFTDYEARAARQRQEQAARDRERRMQRAVLTIRKKYGKNAILKGMNLEEGATARDRNSQIGGHKA